MKMKLAITVALSHNAQLLLLDEATSGLDPIVRDEIFGYSAGFYPGRYPWGCCFLPTSPVIWKRWLIILLLSIKERCIFSEPKDLLLENTGFSSVRNPNFLHWMAA